MEQTNKKEIIKPQKNNRNRGSKYLLVIIFSIIIGAILMFLLIKLFPIGNVSTIINKSEKEVTITDSGIADAVEKLYDAVVVVEVYKSNQLYGSGTGFVYKVNGNKAYILTNNHVVSSGDSYKVVFTDGKTIETKVEGSDVYSDLAVLSVDKDAIISVATIGTSTDMRLGDTVFTIGAPLDTTYYWTVTRGVLSGKDRMVAVNLSQNSQTMSSDYVMKVLQTDASINSGNSGGPLANSNGEVIGITNMKLVSDGVEGIGFAIPIEDATVYADSIIEGKSVERPLLGVEMLDLTNRYYLYQQGITLNTELTQGVVVVTVQSKSPADTAGLTRGDIITKIDDMDVADVAHLRYYLYKHSVGDKVKITFERDGKIKNATVKLTVAN